MLTCCTCCSMWLMMNERHMEKKWQISWWNGATTFAIQICIFIIKDKRYIGGAENNTPHGTRVFLKFHYLRVNINTFYVTLIRHTLKVTLNSYFFLFIFLQFFTRIIARKSTLLYVVLMPRRFVYIYKTSLNRDLIIFSETERVSSETSHNLRTDLVYR